MKIRGIFWKIFLSLWLVSLFIASTTSYFALEAIESHHFKERQQVLITEAAQRIVQKLESGNFNKKRRKFMGGNHGNNFPLRIFHDDQLVFELGDLNSRGEKLYSTNITSPTGKDYRVETIKRPPPRFVVDALKRLNVLYFIVALLGSAVASLLLSWSFTRPLKSLSRFSQRYAKDNHASIDAKLLGRGDEIGDLARDFNYMTNEVERKSEAQRQLLYDVSHELRAPLARLQAAAAIVEQTLPNATDELLRIHLESENISALVQRILDFSRIEERALELEEISMDDFIKDLIEEMSYEYPERQFDFKNSCPSLSLSIHVDLIRHALSNILQNACKYSPPPAPVDILLETEKDFALITVRDYGEGIRPSELQNLTKAFYRGDGAAKAEGFGLGLSISKRAVEKNNGILEIENHTDKGLVVTIKLPR